MVDEESADGMHIHNNYQQDVSSSSIKTDAELDVAVTLPDDGCCPHCSK